MEIIRELISFVRDLYNKTGGYPGVASGATLIGTLLYQQYHQAGSEHAWEAFLNGDDFNDAYNKYMGNKLDMSPEDVEKYRWESIPNTSQRHYHPKYPRSLDGVNEFKADNPTMEDILDQLVDSVNQSD